MIDRLTAVEMALVLLGFKKCIYCGEFHRTGDFVYVQEGLKDGAVTGRTLCPTCRDAKLK